VWAENARAWLEAALQRQLIPPLPPGVVDAAERAIDLVRADAADRLVEIDAGPVLPAGTLVEMLGLDSFVED